MNKSVCIFCASSPRTPKVYDQAARELARRLVGDDCGVVYGGGSIGLMGAVADEVLALGGKITGVIPRFMVDVEWQHKGVSDMRLVGTMSERKQMMVDLCDAIIILPGSTGTLDEMFESLSNKKLGLHGKPIILFNINGFYDPLIAQLQRMVDEEFMTRKHLECLAVATTCDEAMTLLHSLGNQTNKLLEARVKK